MVKRLLVYVCCRDDHALSVLPVCSLLCCEIKLFLVWGLFLEFDVLGCLGSSMWEAGTTREGRV